ncbi:MAG: AbiH family protein [Rikenellaceae bacterium]
MKNLFIIGNGFDLNLGYKTGYSDFMVSKQFVALVTSGNKLCIHLKDRENLCNWVDIEEELIEYSKLYNPEDRNRDLFRFEYYALRDALCDYIRGIDLTIFDHNAYLGRVATNPNYNFTAEDTVVLDFNYTDSFRYLIAELCPEHAHNCTVINVHGLAKENNIIFGVQESANKNPDDIWLLKNVDRNYKEINIYDYLIEAKHIFFLGFSIGVSDHSYFADFFQNYAIYYKDKPKKHIYLPYYKEEGRLCLHKQIFALSHGKLTKTKNTFNLHFIDIEEQQAQMEEQNNANQV